MDLHVYVHGYERTNKPKNSQRARPDAVDDDGDGQILELLNMDQSDRLLKDLPRRRKMRVKRLTLHVRSNYPVEFTTNFYIHRTHEFASRKR